MPTESKVIKFRIFNSKEEQLTSIYGLFFFFPSYYATCAVNLQTYRWMGNGNHRLCKDWVKLLTTCELMKKTIAENKSEVQLPILLNESQ